jgi:hypothetical protein
MTENNINHGGKCIAIGLIYMISIILSLFRVTGETVHTRTHAYAYTVYTVYRHRKIST